MSTPPRPGDGREARRARRAAVALMQYWRERGHPEVVVELVEEPSDVGAAWGIRSNLVNGLPPAAAKRGHL